LKLLIFYVLNKRFNIWTSASYSDRLVAELSSRHLLTPVGTVDRSYHTGGYVVQREVQRHSHEFSEDGSTNRDEEQANERGVLLQLLSALQERLAVCAVFAVGFISIVLDRLGDESRVLAGSENRRLRPKL